MDIIDQIDAALSCHMCSAGLGDSVSDMFCSPWCQQAWHAARSEPLTHYVEPDDLPQHYSNLLEEEAPETTPAAPDHLPHTSFNDVFAALTRNARRERPTHNLYVASNPSEGSWFGDALRSGMRQAERTTSDVIAEWIEHYVREAPVLSHASVNGDGTVTWHLEPWQRTLLDMRSDRLRQAVAELGAAATAAARATEPFRRLHFNNVVRSRQREREDQAAAVEPDARARALDRVRNRNTGPAPRHQRPPRDLGPRR